MKKHTSKFLAVFLTLAMTLGLLAAAAIPASALVCSGCGGTGWELCFWCAGTGEYLTCPGEHSYMRFSPPTTACDQLLISDPNVWCQETLEMRPCNVNSCEYRADAGYYGDACGRCGGTGEPNFADKVGAELADASSLLDNWLVADGVYGKLDALDDDAYYALAAKCSSLALAYYDAHNTAEAAGDVDAAVEAYKTYLRGMIALYEEYLGITAPEALKDAIAPALTVCTVCGEDPCVCETPNITGPQSLFIKQGYAAASSDAFNVTGTPAPTVAVTVKPGDTGNGGKITWNAVTKKLDIAPGLAQGDYRVFLTVSNGVGPPSEHSFTVTVDPPGSGSDDIKYVRLFGLKTDYPSTFWNWFKFIALFGFIWMWFI